MICKHWAPEFYPKAKKIPVCKFCGKTPLKWRRVESNWLLCEKNGEVHQCPNHELPIHGLKEVLRQKKLKSMSYNGDGRCGGRGTCEYCHEMHNNVAYHEAHECSQRPMSMEERIQNDLRLSISNWPPAYDALTGKAVVRQLLPIPSWDETFMHDVYWWARRSKDPRTKIGAVLVLPGDKDPISHGYNGFAREVDDNVPERWERPEKYEWVTHAEENSVLNCSRKGQSSKGAVMFTQGVPCSRCTDAVIQGGIVEIVVHKQWQEYEKKFNWDKWIDSAKRSEQKLKEAGIKVRVFDGVLRMQGVLDGKVINI